MHEIEIGKLGLQTDGRGINKNFTPEFFDEVVSSYNPSNFKAPFIISHDTKGVPDAELADNKELAFGFPDKLKVVGDRLKACFSKISPRIKKFYENGDLLSLSPSFYPPNHSHNPAKGKWSLRHIAGLGITPPAIKGLATPSFSEIGFNPENDTLEFCFCIDKVTETSEGELSFSMMGNNLVDILSNIRDYFVESKGADEAEKLIPRESLGYIMEGDRYHDERHDRTDEKIYKIERKMVETHSPPEPKMETIILNEQSLKSNMNLPITLSRLAENEELSQQDVAIAMDLSEEEIANIFSGAAKPTNEQLVDFSELFEVELSDILSYAGHLGKEEKKKKMKMKMKKKMKDENDEDDEDEEESFSESSILKRRIQELESKQAVLERSRKADLARMAATSQQLENQKNERKRDRISSFCEDLVKEGRILAFQMGEYELSFGEEESSNLDLVDFLMGLDEEQLSFAETFLSKLEPQIDINGEFARQSNIREQAAVTFSVAPGYQVTEESANEFQLVLDYMEEHNLDINNDEEYNQACLAVFK